MNEVKWIDGGLGVDDRGTTSFVNGFSFEGVQRFYVVENFSESTIRAFHGHKKEAKYCYVAHGSAIVACVKIDDFANPNRQAPVQRFVLSARKPGVLFIPAGYSNGLRALEPQTKLIFFSTSTLEESKGDDYRLAADYFGEKIWEIENR